MCAVADLISLEPPSNPVLIIADLDVICAAPRKQGAILAVDNTYATPLNQMPLVLGAGVAVQSATKFIGGHSDLRAAWSPRAMKICGGLCATRGNSPAPHPAPSKRFGRLSRSTRLATPLPRTASAPDSTSFSTPRVWAVESTVERRASIPGQEHLPPTLLRLSVGIEGAEDLWADLDQALEGRRN
jgi:cystathionine beta-lyase/cystathionine gamma-synthase